MKTFYKWVLRRKKSAALIEVLADMSFIEEHRQEQLNYNEAVARAELKRERDKKEPDEERVAKIGMEIHESQAVKQEYAKIKEMARELPLYIENIKNI